MKSNGQSIAGPLFDRDPNAAYVLAPGANLVEYRASRKWRNRISGKLHLSIRKAGCQRRPLVSAQDAAVFVEKMALTLRRISQWTIVNMDEMSRKVIENHAYAGSISGIEGVPALFSGDPKMCVTAIISISATGDRLPMIVIAKVRHDRYECVFCSHSEKAIKEHRLVMTHQETGWTTAEVAVTYLR
jgi:hypothetical protein